MKSDWPVGVSELCTAGALAARLLLWSTCEMTNPALPLSRSIDASPAEVAALARDPANLPAWAAGLSNGIREAGGHWITDSPMGEVEVRFGPHTELGILDHDVIFPDGTIVHNPLRILANGTGAEVVSTLYPMPGVDDVEFDRDADLVRADLAPCALNS
ncbi:hypothetical protein BI49514_00085 [Brevibacterium iodinum ATCC 49514]|uniref:Polyketide cyclase / dehydrase and lipid transport n=2 Tax=Brevibacterium iodinum TaxID=31943 RepID=A0A2H1HP13_9MICO|nr:hypothetical protein BI49514_00085 [Brevibacterium iodinum ATCC 49514]SUW13369.1 Uncharacterised protein [Brevibacterium iodinum]